jgi:hypothetical protein
MYILNKSFYKSVQLYFLYLITSIKKTQQTEELYK